jgi:hypothetical protein
MICFVLSPSCVLFELGMICVVVSRMDDLFCFVAFVRSV